MLHNKDLLRLIQRKLKWTIWLIILTRHLLSYKLNSKRLWMRKTQLRLKQLSVLEDLTLLRDSSELSVVNQRDGTKLSLT